MKRHLACVSSILFVSLVISFINTPVTATGGTDLLADEKPLGESLESWAIKYWRWWATVPPGYETNSCVMYSVPNASMVFLINPYTMNYQGNCDIPSDRYILVPLLVGECDPTLPVIKTGKIEELWKCAQAADEPFESWNVVLDNEIITRNWGNKVVNPDLIQRILVRNSAQFMIEIPENNQFDVKAGTYPAVVDGYYLVLKPLPPGEHTLKYQISQEKVGAGVGNVQPSVGGAAMYNMHVS